MLAMIRFLESNVHGAGSSSTPGLYGCSLTHSRAFRLFAVTFHTPFFSIFIVLCVAILILERV
jgi:hypothetical protein